MTSPTVLPVAVTCRCPPVIGRSKDGIHTVATARYAIVPIARRTTAGDIGSSRKR
jgi:hypothetical protein